MERITRRGRIWGLVTTFTNGRRLGALGATIGGALLGGALLTAGLPTAADAARPKAQAKRCHTPPAVSRKMINDNPSAKVAVRLTGRSAQSFIDVLNRLEPVTDHKTDLVLIFSKPSASSYFVLVFKSGCLSFGSDIKTLQFRRLWPDISVEGVSI